MMQEALKEIYRDELTGVYNRKYLNLILERELARTRRYKDSLSLLILDLDNFKEINDSYGHLEGDKTLVKFASVLQEEVRDSDTIVRYGGDEFVIIAPSTNYDGAVTFAERILKRLEGVKTPLGSLRASIGIATYPDHGTDFKNLFEYADSCLYDAKRSGKGRIGLYKDSNLAPSIPPPVFVGRRKERSYIIQGLKEPGKIHIITGDAGVGKTRLVKDTFSTMGLRFANGMAYGAITSMPYVVIRTLLLDMLKRFPVDLKEAFGKLSESSRVEIAKLIPQLGVGVDKSLQSGDKFTLFAGISELLSEISKDETVVLLLDDLHWADRLSLELLYYTIHMQFPNLVVFATARGDEIQGSPLESTIHLLGRERLYDELVLEPMSLSEVKMLTEVILKRISDDRLVKEVYDFSGGNPFFVEEFIRMMYDRGYLFYDNGTWKLRDGARFELPKSIKDTIDRKLERLDEKELNVLRYSACAGRDFYPEIIGGVMKVNVGEVYGVLDKLVKMNILVEKEDGELYAFKEDAIRLVILDSMGEGIKKVMYNAIGEYVEERFGVNEDNVEMVLHYFELGKNKEKLAKYGELAGDRSQSVYAHENAIKYYEYALSMVDNSEREGTLHRKIGYSFLLLGKYEEALKHFKKAYKLLPLKRSETEGRFIAYTYNLMGDKKKAIDHYKKAIELADNLNEKVGYKFMLAYHLASIGKRDEAEKIAKEALSDLPDEPDEVRALGYNTLGVIYEGYRDKKHFLMAEDYFKKALSIASEGKVGKRNIAAFYNNLAGLYATQGEYEKALSMFLEVKKIHEEMNFAYGRSLIYGNLAMLYMDMGECAKSVKYAEDAIKINSAIAREHLNLPLYHILGLMLYELEEYDRAEDVLLKAIQIGKEKELERDELQNMAVFLKVRIEQGKLEDVSDVVRDLEEFMVKNNVFMSVIFDALVYYYDAMNDEESAKELISFSESLIEENDGTEQILLNAWKLVVLKEGKEFFEDSKSILSSILSLFTREKVYVLYLIVRGLRPISKRASSKYLRELKKLLKTVDLPRIKNKVEVIS